jgi:hypothetical protein
MNFRPHVGVNLWISHIASHLLPIDLCILCTAKKGSCCWPAYKVTGKIHRRKYPRNLGLRDRDSAAIVQVHINGEQDNCAAGRNLPQSTPWKLKVELWKNKEHPLPTPSVGVASVCLFFGQKRCSCLKQKVPSRYAQVDALFDLSLTDMPADTDCTIKSLLEPMYPDLGITCVAWCQIPRLWEIPTWQCENTICTGKSAN